MGLAMLSMDSLFNAGFFKRKTAVECVDLANAFAREKSNLWEKSSSKRIIIEKLSKFIESADLDECLTLVLDRSINGYEFQLPEWDPIFTPSLAMQIYRYFTAKGNNREHFLSAKLKMRILSLCKEPKDYEKAIAMFKAYGDKEFTSILAQKRFA